MLQPASPAVSPPPPASSRSLPLLRWGIGLLFIFALGAAVAGGAYWLSTSPARGESPITSKVSLAPFEQVVLEQGEVESSQNFEVKCKVKSEGGTEIIWVIEEGTTVKEGDVLAKLNSSALEQQRDSQSIVLDGALANKIQAENLLTAAEIAKTEYLEGTFEQEQQLIQSEIFVAEENLRRAQRAAESAERLAVKGLVTPLQLRADLFALNKAAKELETARTKLRVLQDYTKEKMEKTLSADIATAQAQLEAYNKIYRGEESKLKDIIKQIAYCEIKYEPEENGPESGQVIYANEYSRRGGDEFMVKAGARVRERQTVFRIPNTSSMLVKAKVNESRVTQVKAGQSVNVRIDALGDVVVPGVVTRVNDYAEPSSWFSSNIKEYGTEIAISTPPPGIRPGLTAEVRIFVERQPEALQAPIQALYEHKGHLFCLVENGKKYETREVQIASANDKTAWFTQGLSPGETVVINPRAHQDRFQFPADLKAREKSPERSPGKEAVAMREKQPAENEGPQPRPVSLERKPESAP